MSTVVQNCGITEQGYDRRIHMKGAAEIVLEGCSHYLNEYGQKVQLTDEYKSQFNMIIS